MHLVQAQSPEHTRPCKPIEAPISSFRNGSKHRGTEGLPVCYHLPFSVVVDDDPYDLSTLDVQGTPQTILVAGGKVIHNWSGAYEAAVKGSIQSTLHVSLPAIATDTK